MPESALLARYRDAGAYINCYTIDVEGTVTQAAYVGAFYTSWLFKVERWILGWTVHKPSTDDGAVMIAKGNCDAFSAWTVEERTQNQLLMCDFQHRTRSWLMTEPIASGTRLYFGTAVVPLWPDGRKDNSFGLAFRLLLGFHKLYARALLRAARDKLMR